MLDDFQEVIGAGNLVNGYELNDDRAGRAVEKSKQWALDLKPKLRGFSTDDDHRTWSAATPGSTTSGTATSSTSATRSRSPRTTRSRSARRGIPVGTRLLRDPRQRRAPGHRADVHRLHARARERVEEHRVHGLPDALQGPRRDVRGAGQGRPGDRRHDRRPRERPAVREPRRATAGARGTRPGRRSRPAEAQDDGRPLRRDAS